MLIILADVVVPLRANRGRWGVIAYTADQEGELKAAVKKCKMVHRGY